jgi:hypothetical protein
MVNLKLEQKQKLSLKDQHMNKVVSKDLELYIQGNIIELVEEGYTEQDIKDFLMKKMVFGLEFLEEYIGL